MELSGEPLSLTQFNGLVNGNGKVALPLPAALQKKLARSVDIVNDALIDKEVIYGITTGFGGMSNTRIDCQSAAALQSNLLTFLAASAGPEIHSKHTLGAMLLRANVLLQGKSGVRAEVVEQLLRFFEAGAVPVVRELGSIGASGDLIPLSTIARAVTGSSGRARVRFADNDEVLDAKPALERLKLSPIELRPKEGLALINGTSFSCAVAANSMIAAEQALSISFAIEAMLMTALKVNPAPFADFVHQSKPHPGQVWSADMIRKLLSTDMPIAADDEHVQDRYSLRCFPQYIGAIVEGIARVGHVVEIEMNSVSDNPLIDVDNRTFHQSGNFLGQYIGIAMDDLRRFIGLTAKHLDVQIASLVAPEFNRGLSPSLRGNDERSYNMGLKGLQICGNSIMPMLTWQANPIVEHFPTHAEQFNQNVNGLSWGAANMAWKSVELFQQYLAVATLFAIQSVDLRAKSTLGHFDGRKLLSESTVEFYEAACEIIEVKPDESRPMLLDDTDRWLEQDIERLATDITNQGKLINSVQAIADDFADFKRSQA
ncbi:aromatic amino acid ammonia-lyase [Mariniblastus sp.]|nr:aromatic amino acid ammonia-lyase [Mariniblastus sp.]